MLRKAKNQAGFTLVELLVVILIIGILAAIAIPAFTNNKSTSCSGTHAGVTRTWHAASESTYGSATAATISIPANNQGISLEPHTGYRATGLYYLHRNTPENEPIYLGPNTTMHPKGSVIKAEVCLQKITA